MADKPVVHASYSEISGIDKPEPFVYTTKASKRIVFPDLFDMEFEEAEEFLNDIAGEVNNSVVLKKWLKTEDYKALKADRHSLRGITTLVEKVKAHYEGLTSDTDDDE